MEDVEENYSSMELFKREINKATIFRDIHELEPSYIPEQLLFRNDIFKQLIHTYKRSLKKEHSVSCALLGPCGSGKTTIAKNFAHNFKYAIYEEQPNFFVEYYNCIEFRSKSQILRNIIGKYNKGSGRGFSNEEMWQMIIKQLSYNNSILFLIIDEVQFLNVSDILGFIDVGEIFGNSNARISILLLSRTKDWYELENERILSRLNHKIELHPYTWDEAFEILKQRSEAAFREGIISTEVLKKITDITIETSNLRHGIELLRKVGLNAEIEGLKTISLDLLDEMRKEVYSPFRAEIIDKINDHELLALYATLKTLKEQKIAYVNDIYPVYEVICQEHSVSPQVKMSFRKHLRTLSSLNLFDSTLAKGSSSRGWHLKVSFPNSTSIEFFEFELQTYLKKRFGGK